jgi:hypothetical protein
LKKRALNKSSKVQGRGESRHRGDLAELLLAIAAGADDPWGSRIRDFASTVPPGVSVAPVGPAERGRARRDAALRKFALEQYPGLDVQLLADEIATDVRRYAAAGWLFDRAHAALRPEHARDPVRAHLFEAFKATDGKVPVSPKQVVRILKPLFEQQKSGHADGVAMSGKAISSQRAKGRNRMNAPVVKFDPNAAAARTAERLLDAVAASGPGKAAAAELAAKDLAKRERCAAELVDLRKEELAAIEAAVDRDEIAAEIAATRAKLRELELKSLSLFHVSVGRSFSFDAQRNELMTRLKKTARPEIGAFIRQMREETERLRKEQPLERSTREKSAITGKFVGETKSNLASIIIRMHACRRAAEDAEALYLQPNQDTVPAQLGELLRNLPDIYELRPAPRYGSHLLLSDLNNGMELKAALVKHCL